MIVAAISLIGTGLVPYPALSPSEYSSPRSGGLLGAASPHLVFYQYVLHSDNNFLYPYDLPSLFFFTAAASHSSTTASSFLCFCSFQSPY